MNVRQLRYLMALAWLQGYLNELDAELRRMGRRGCDAARCSKFHIAHKALALIRFDRDIARAAS